MKTHGVYVHKKPNGVVFYIGKGTERRANCLNARNLHHGNIVAKYGKENIIVDFLPCASEQQAFDFEVVLIKLFREDGVRLTNLADGGIGGATFTGRTHTQEAKEKCRAAATGRQPFLGRTHTPEVRARIAAAMSTRIISKETKAKISKSLTGKKQSKDVIEKRRASLKGKLLGRKFSTEHRIKLSIAHQGKHLPQEVRAKIGAAQKGKPWSNARWAAERRKKNAYTA